MLNKVTRKSTKAQQGFGEGANLMIRRTYLYENK
jgi:hypothetical protein